MNKDSIGQSYLYNRSRRPKRNTQIKTTKKFHTYQDDKKEHTDQDDQKVTHRSRRPKSNTQIKTTKQ